MYWKLIFLFFLLTMMISASAKETISEYIHLQQSHYNLKSVEQLTYYLAFRKNGQLKSEHWGSNWKVLSKDIHQQLSTKDSHYDWVEVNLVYNKTNVKRHSPLLRNIYRGVKGITFEVDGKLHRYSPTQMLAKNKSFKKILKPFKNKEIKQLQVFDVHQFLIKIGNSPSHLKITPAFRGNQIIKPEEVTQENVRSLAKGMADWMLEQVSNEGEATYKYWPSRKLDKQPNSNNMIRQWMASVCLARLAQGNYGGAKGKLNSNLQYNLEKYYRVDNRLGIIPYNNKVKLGAIALAALALHESPLRSLYRQQEESLNRTIHTLWQPNGRFKTFYKSSQNHNHNFYPGEALLYWVTRYKKTKSPELLNKIMTSFRYYREWHLNPRNRNPAFIPWHTQAYYQLWTLTREPELQGFIFEMNDWLLNHQQWDDVKFNDTKGRFYTPSKRYGPPHASSTGVYLEGLIDAFQLARAVKDSSREKAYKIAILRGLRSLMQLQFVDDIDMFYISQKKKVKGGLRTTVYSNEIRIDNVQHSLMAVMKILQVLKPLDYYEE